MNPKPVRGCVEALNKISTAFMGLVFVVRNENWFTRYWHADDSAEKIKTIRESVPIRMFVIVLLFLCGLDKLVLLPVCRFFSVCLRSTQPPLIFSSQL